MLFAHLVKAGCAPLRPAVESAHDLVHARQDVPGTCIRSLIQTTNQVHPPLTARAGDGSRVQHADDDLLTGRSFCLPRRSRRDDGPFERHQAWGWRGWRAVRRQGRQDRVGQCLGRAVRAETRRRQGPPVIACITSRVKLRKSVTEFSTAPRYLSTSASSPRSCT